MTTTQTPTVTEPSTDAGESGAPASSEAEKKVWMTFESLAALAFAVALVAVFLAVFSMGLASRAIDEHRAIPAGGSSAAEPAPVGLKEFEIGTGPIEVPAGTVLRFTNEGTTVHDVAIEGDGATPQIQPGEDAELDLSELEPGTYTVFCQLPGHRESGMETTLTIT